ncbi:hypothetical protein B0F90DRAFT_1696878 [Multifurca ochricompacta]|uniref:Uncharacterized protein n=1 Tax=Multifurca ochricompacta TaxID=376703 RepID=A0AAD4M9B2_9AGAM|nr:hypothetical protein B0F90DRAFT_1696878 [Multifurca ochricompacta]
MVNNSLQPANSVPRQSESHDHMFHTVRTIPISGDVHDNQIPPPVRDMDSQGRPHDPLYMSRGPPDMGFHYPPVSNNAMPPYIYHNVGATQGTTAQAQVVTPEFQGNGGLGYAPQYTAPVPTGVLPNEWPHQAPIPNEPAAERFRRLASRYLHHPDSLVHMVDIELDNTGRFKMVITLQLADIL